MRETGLTIHTLSVVRQNFHVTECAHTKYSQVPIIGNRQDFERIKESKHFETSTMASRKRYLRLVVSLFAVGGAVGECNVCRNGGQVSNPGHSFQMDDPANGKKIDWTCGWLEESVADVNPQGAPGEAFLCGLAQLWAEKECECTGPPIPPLSDYVIDPNPSCDLCAGNHEFDYVPGVLADELVDTGIAGRMPCGGLYGALSNGVLPGSLCPTVQNNAGAFCCNLPSIQQYDLELPSPNTSPVPAPVMPPTSSCKEIFEGCGNAQCCGSMQCKVRAIGQDPICSSTSTRKRQSLAGTGSGGAAGRVKYGN